MKIIFNNLLVFILVNEKLFYLWKELNKRITIFLSTSRLAIPLVLASFVGITTGLIAVGFIKFIEFNEGLFFGRGREILGFLGPYSVIFIPAIGGLIVGPIVNFITPEAKGHGVPEVMKAITLRGGRIRPIVILGKMLASAFAIGSGASVGREGPIVQVGSAVGSTVAQFFKLSEAKIKNLLACGAAAGISAVFNAPIAGVMFSLEVILRDFGARALSTVVVAAVASSIISRIFLGESPAFIAPAYTLESPYEIFLYIGLGLISALVAILFISVLNTSEKVFERWRFPEWLKPMIGGLLIGCIGFYFPQIFGSGLSTIENALLGGLGLQILLALVFLKIIATSLSLASGSSGGVFAPALFIGAVLGGAVGKLLYGVVPFEIAPPGAYAIAGMASVFAGAAHAPVTAILIVFEMTGSYEVILPIMASVVVATSFSQLIQRESIYTIKLKQKGIDIEQVEEAKYLGAIQVRDAMTTKFEIVPYNLSSTELISRMSKHRGKSFFVINSNDEISGVIKPGEVQETLFEKDAKDITAGDIASSIKEVCFPDEPLNEAATLMMAQNLTQIPVVDPASPNKAVGVLRSEDVFRAYTNISTRRSDLLSRVEPSSEVSGVIEIRFRIPLQSPVVGKQIKEIKVPDGVILTSIQRKKITLLPEGNTTLQARDKIWALVTPKNEKIFKEWLKSNNLKTSSVFGS